LIYPLLEIILLVVSAMVSGFEDWTSIKKFGDNKPDWIRTFLSYEHGIPVDDTIARVMRKLDTKMFKTCFAQWMKTISQATDGDIIAIDGKQLHRSYSERAGTPAIHRVSALSNANSVVLGQVKTADKRGL
jgi:DDE_Tnp_1-associated